MPFTVNGFGTSVCGGRGNIGWGSYDGMEWLVGGFMPIVPIKAVHTFDWNGNQYRMIPIKWSFGLVLRTFFTRWAWGIGALGLIFFFVGVVERHNNHVGFFIAAGVLVALATLLLVLLRVTDARNKSIRRVLGAQTIGNADPAHLTRKLLDDIEADPRVAYGTRSYAEAAAKLLREGSYARAMWAARMAVAVEDAAEGERITDEILNDTEVRDGIARVAKDANQWAQLMCKQGDPQPPEDLPVIHDAEPADPDDRYRGAR